MENIFSFDHNNADEEDSIKFEINENKEQKLVWFCNGKSFRFEQLLGKLWF